MTLIRRTGVSAEKGDVRLDAMDRGENGSNNAATRTGTAQNIPLATISKLMSKALLCESSRSLGHSKGGSTMKTRFA